MNVTPNKINSIIAHDLKDPLTSISGITDILIKYWNDITDDEKTDILKEIRETSDTTLLLLTDLLDWSKKKAEISGPEKSIFEAEQQIKGILEPLFPKLKRKNITVENQVPPGMMLFGDANMFASVIRNLITNAVKSCPNGGNISVSADFEGSFCRFCISDNGIGMTKSQIDALFPKIVPGTHTNSSASSGSGFGLILCHDFVEMNGGGIWAESGENQGTKVFFTVPSHNG